MKKLSENLLTRLTQADICCRDCGALYGKYSVGCSSTWEAECHVCGETKGVTEVRDWGYLTKGINELRGNIKEQSKVVASYMASVGPIMSDKELDDVMMASYEEGELTCKFSEAEVTALAEVLDAHAEEYPPGKNVDYDSAFMKVMELYGDYCLTYEMSPAAKAYYAKFASYGNDDEKDRIRWATFRDAFHAGFEFSKEGGK